MVSLISSVGKVLCANSVLLSGHEFESRSPLTLEEAKLDQGKEEIKQIGVGKKKITLRQEKSKLIIKKQQMAPPVFMMQFQLYFFD